MSPPPPNKEKIYTSPYPRPHVPSNRSLWQHLLECNIDDIPPSKILWQEWRQGGGGDGGGGHPPPPPSKSLTFGEAPGLFARGAAGLLSSSGKAVDGGGMMSGGGLGLKPGDTVFLLGGNSLDWVVLAHSCVWAGIVPAGASPLSTPHELVHCFTISEARVVFCEPAYMLKAQKAISLLSSSSDFPFPKPRIVGLGGTGDGAIAELTFPQDFISSTQQQPESPLPPPLDLSNQQDSDNDNHSVPAAIVFSSGTTSGKPKAVQLSHRNLLGTILGMRASVPEQVNSSINEVFYAPLYHIYGLVAACLSPAYSGVTTTLLSFSSSSGSGSGSGSFDMHEYVKAVTATRANILRVVPPTAVALAKDPWIAASKKAAAEDFLGCVHTIQCAGAVLAPEIIGKLDELMPGAKIVQGYGMSEASLTTLRTIGGPETEKKSRLGSVGRLMGYAEIRIVDDDLNDVSPGTTGEILTRGDTVFMSYKNDPSATAEAFPFSSSSSSSSSSPYPWMRTGDVGRMDPQGFLYLTDRKKDLIKYKGFQVAPAELEDVLLSHPLVTEAGVCAAWDDEAGTEVPVAYVNLQQQQQQPEMMTSANNKEQDEKKTKEKKMDNETALTLEEIRKYHDERVSPYKRLRGGLFYLKEGLPRNPTGKLLRRELPARKKRDAKEGGGAVRAKL